MRERALTQRQAKILQIIIAEYIDTATPVASDSIARKGNLGVSPATVRNEMAALESQGFIEQPHTSAGRIPTDQGYRRYVESLMEEDRLPLAEQLLVRHQFHQVERELEEWIPLAAAILSHLAQNLALVSLPRARASQVRHLQLLSLNDFLALLILISQETWIRQCTISFDQVMNQEELEAMARKLNHDLSGLTAPQVTPRLEGLSLPERQVALGVARLLRSEDERTYEEPYFRGQRYLLGQPEFLQGERLSEIMLLLGEGGLWQSLLPQALASGQGVQVIIGHENPVEPLRGYSLILSPYQLGASGRGAIGVLGPTRMPYRRTVPAVRYMASLMRELGHALGN